MLKSMTGFGEARAHDHRMIADVEVRSVNNRYLKVAAKLPESHAKLEVDVERIVRERLSRGTVSISLRIVSLVSSQMYRLNEEVIAGYMSQLAQLTDRPHDLLSAVLTLPGSVVESLSDNNVELDAPLIREAIEKALTELEAMRTREGQAMQRELEKHCDAIDAGVDKIIQRSPEIARGYRDRLLERVNELLADRGLSLQPADIIREVSIYADRGDVSEEMVRLKSHVQQFRQLMKSHESCGRKLDFVCQEMFRECNTTGSKSTDADVSAWVVDMKSTIERVREMIANVE